MLEFENLKKLVADVEADVAKADTGNKSACTRVRKAMQGIKSAAQAIRVKVLETKGNPTPAPAAPTGDCKCTGCTCQGPVQQ